MGGETDIEDGRGAIYASCGLWLFVSDGGVVVDAGAGIAAARSPLAMAKAGTKTVEYFMVD